MDLRVDVITVVVPDLPEAHAFYVDRLGWEAALIVPGEITFLPAGAHRMVALFARGDLARDIGDGGNVPAFTLGQVFETPEGTMWEFVHNPGSQLDVGRIETS